MIRRTGVGIAGKIGDELGHEIRERSGIGTLCEAIALEREITALLESMNQGDAGSLVVPSDVWLTSMAVQAPIASASPVPPVAGSTPAPVPTANSFTIEGNAYSHEGVARLLTRLALVPDLGNVTLGSSTLIAPGKRSAVQFTINASVRAPGGGS